jgi:hypothetical protein
MGGLKIELADERRSPKSPKLVEKRRKSHLLKSSGHPGESNPVTLSADMHEEMAQPVFPCTKVLPLT